MDVRDYIRVLRKRWPIIVLCVVIGVAAAVAYAQTTKKVYEASAQIFVAASASGSNTTAQNNGNSFVTSRVQSYPPLVKSPDVAQAALNQLKITTISASQLRSKITADAPLNKVLLNLHVRDGSPLEAAKLANAIATQFVTYVEKVEATNSGSDQSPVKLTVFEPASVPSGPTSPNAKLDLIIGLLAGLVVGFAIAALRETFDTRLRSVEDIGEETTASVLSVVPLDRKASSSPLAFRSDERGPRAEAFRQLRTNLQYIDVDSPPKLIAMTSAVSGEGKSTTAVNLASSMAEAGMKICLVDADLRRPTVAKNLGLVSGGGLTSILAGKASIGDVLQAVGPNLSVITSGPIPPNPSELLASAQFRAILHSISEQVDFVVIDSAPLLPVADGSEVASAADVNILVIRAGRTTREQLREAVGSLERVGAHLGGIVFNMAAGRESGSYYEYYAADDASERPARHVNS